MSVSMECTWYQLVTTPFATLFTKVQTSQQSCPSMGHVTHALGPLRASLEGSLNLGRHDPELSDGWPLHI
jgi:hypothetical protein